MARARLDAEAQRAQAVARREGQRPGLGPGERDAAEQHAREIEQEADRTRSADLAATVAVVRSLALQEGEAGGAQ